MDYILPVGGRFLPEDHELIGHFLFKKLNGGLSPEEAEWVPECDLYGKEEPWVMFQRLKTGLSGGDVFVFTELKCKDKGKKNIDRRVGGGCWHGEDSGKEIAVNGQIKAKKKRFSYRNKGSDHHGGWILHEYSLPNCPIVLCRLRNKSSDLNPESEATDGPVLDFDFFDINVEGSNKRMRPEFENPAAMDGNITTAATSQSDWANSSDSPTEERTNLESTHGVVKYMNSITNIECELSSGSVKRRRLEFNSSADNNAANIESNINHVELEGNNTMTDDFEKWVEELQNLEMPLEKVGGDLDALISGDIDIDSFLEDIVV